MKKRVTIFSQSADQPERVWPGLFRLYRNPDGTTRVEYEAATAMREWALRWKLNPTERQLARAFLFLEMAAESPLPEIPEPKHLAPFGGSNVFKVHEAAMYLRSVSKIIKIPVDSWSEAIGGKLKIVTDPTLPKAGRLKAKDSIMKSIAKTLEALVERSERKAHGSARILEGYDGEPLLAWAVLEATRCLVEVSHELPTKKDVKSYLERKEKKLRTVSSPQWAAAFKDAGLESLPRASPRKTDSRKSRRNC
jgi:hypothetical protein